MSAFEAKRSVSLPSRRLTLALVVGLAMVTGLPQSAVAAETYGPNLLLDGGFEMDRSGSDPDARVSGGGTLGAWAVAPLVEGTFGTPLGDAVEGSRYLGDYVPLDPARRSFLVLTQSFAVEPGASYLVTFSSRGADPDSQITVSMSDAGGGNSVTDATSGSWAQRSFSYVATASVAAVRLDATASSGIPPSVDGVSVRKVSVVDTPIFQPQFVVSVALVSTLAVAASAFLSRRSRSGSSLLQQGKKGLSE